MIKAILWDNDGVLVDTERFYFQSTRSVLLDNGITITEELYRQNLLFSNRGVWFLAEDKGFTEEEILAMKKLRDQRYQMLIRECPEVAIPHVEEVLETVNSHCTMVVVTSSQRVNFDLIHEKTGFEKYFTFVLAREDYELSKPHPEPYLLAMEKLDLSPDEVVVIEDSERGLRAAKAAGLPCWVIPTDLTRDSDFSAADRVLTNISEVQELILSQSKGRI